jgi:hypothetical protein
MSNVKAPEPLSQLTQVSHGATEAAQTLLRLVPLLEQNTYRYRRLMNIDTATSLIKHFHTCLLSRARKDAECESLPRVLFGEEGYSPLFLNASRVKLISGFKTPLQVTTSCGHDHNSLIPFSSVVVAEGHEQLIPFITTNREWLNDRGSAFREAAPTRLDDDKK